MGLFSKKIATTKSISKVNNDVLKLSQELKEIIVSHNVVDFYKVDLGGLEYALFMYDLEFYRQVMEIKYSKFYIEQTVRAIFINLEDNLRKNGNNIPKNFMLDKFIKLSSSLSKIYNIASQENMDEFFAVAMYLCSDECLLTDNEIDKNPKLIQSISDHFRKIISLPEISI